MEETLNELLEQKAERLTQAARYGRSEARQGTAAVTTAWNLTATSGGVKVPGRECSPF